MLDQWEGWLKKMEERGIVVHLEFCNDATDVEMMGWKLTAGIYDLLWFDTTNGRTVKQSGVQIAASGATWSKPESLGSEIALYVRRQK